MCLPLKQLCISFICRFFFNWSFRVFRRCPELASNVPLLQEHVMLLKKQMKVNVSLLLSCVIVSDDLINRILYQLVRWHYQLVQILSCFILWLQHCIICVAISTKTIIRFIYLCTCVRVLLECVWYLYSVVVRLNLYTLVFIIRLFENVLFVHFSIRTHHVIQGWWKQNLRCVRIVMYI